MTEQIMYNISTTDRNSRILWLQWEDPKDTWLVRHFPQLADWWPHRFRNFVFCPNKKEAADLPQTVLPAMFARGIAYAAKVGISVRLNFEQA